jgi:hypothetical protein
MSSGCMNRAFALYEKVFIWPRRDLLLLRRTRQRGIRDQTAEQRDGRRLAMLLSTIDDTIPDVVIRTI